jgi:hypothetical protein
MEIQAYRKTYMLLETVAESEFTRTTAKLMMATVGTIRGSATVTTLRTLEIWLIAWELCYSCYTLFNPIISAHTDRSGIYPDPAIVQRLEQGGV